MHDHGVTSRSRAHFALLSCCLAMGCGISSPLFVDQGEDAAVAEEESQPDASAPVDDSASLSAEGEPKPPCGSGPGCDPTDLGGETCQSLGLGNGKLLCDPATCTFEISACQASAPCGTGPGCDPSDLDGESCDSLGLGVGTLLCDPITCMFDSSNCIDSLGGAGGTAGGTGTGDGEMAPVFGGGGTGMDGGTAMFGGGGGDGTTMFGGGGDTTGGDGTTMFGGGGDTTGGGFPGGGGTGFFGGGTTDDAGVGN